MYFCALLLVERDRVIKKKNPKTAIIPIHVKKFKINADILLLLKKKGGKNV